MKDIKDNKIELLEEDLWCVHKYLDDLEIPRVDKDSKEYSIVGRIKRLEARYLKQLSETETLHLTETKDEERFFLFTYSYKCHGKNGKENLNLTSKGFPKQKVVLEKALKEIQKKYYEPEYEISIVIENWVEMSKKDYNNWIL